MTLLHELIHAKDDRKGLPNNRTCSPPAWNGRPRQPTSDDLGCWH